MPGAPFGKGCAGTCGGRGADAARYGATLVEICVAIVLLFIVFAGWVRMNNIQAVNRESLRYAAVEKAAGMLDAVVDNIVDNPDFSGSGLDSEGTYLRVNADGSADDGIFDSVPVGPDAVIPLFRDSTDVGYQCHVEWDMVGDSSSSRWNSYLDEDWQYKGGIWVVVDLFDFVGEKKSGSEPFSSVRMLCKLSE